MPSQFQVQYSFANPASSGLTTVVSAQTGQRIIVLQCCVITSGANTVNFAGSVSGPISAAFPLAASGGFVLPYSEVGWFQTAIGEALQINMSAGAGTGVQVVWCPANF
jgi:hypothetical protein